MKKKIFFIAFIVIAIILTGILSVKYSKHKKYEKSIYDISTINYKSLTLKDTKFYNNGNYNCFLIFNSNCEFCINEIEDIVDNIDDFKGVNFYLVSSQSEEELLEYNEDSEFLGIENFTIIYDKEELLLKFFDYPINPSTYIYNKQNKLINYKNGFLQYYFLKNMLEK